MGQLSSWFFAFVFTLGAEALVAVPILGLCGAQVSLRLRLVLLANVLTHPLVTLVTSLASTPLMYIGFVVGAELFAAAAESVVYARAFGRRPWALAVAASCLANGASFLGSLWVFRLIS